MTRQEIDIDLDAVFQRPELARADIAPSHAFERTGAGNAEDQDLAEQAEDRKLGRFAFRVIAGDRRPQSAQAAMRAP